MPKKEIAIKHATILVSYLLVIWGFYRFLFKLPEEVEDLLIKPVLWLIPVFYFLRKEKLDISSIGITSKNLFSSVYQAILLGAIFSIVAVVVNFIKYQGINFSANIGTVNFWLSLGLSFITGFTEEVTFRGYLFTRLWHVFENEWKANIVTSFIWALIHIPLVVFWLELNLSSTLIILLLTSLFGIGSAYIYARTKNVFSSILLHIFWGWPIILFR